MATSTIIRAALRSARERSTPVGLALIGTAVAFLLVTLVPWLLLPNVTYDPAIALAFASTAAIFFTAAYAANNLREFRRASEAEFTPVIDCDVQSVYVSGTRLLEVRVVNLGRGTAAGIDVAVWWTDDDLVTWVPHRLRGVSHVLRSGEESSDSLETTWIHLPLHKHFAPDSAQLVVQVQYRDPYRRTKDTLLPFDIGRDDDGKPILTPSIHGIPSSLQSVEGKKAVLGEQLKLLTEDLDLSSHGLELNSYVDRRVVQAAILKNGKEVWRSNVTIERPVYHTVESVRNALTNLLPAEPIADRERERS